MAVAAAIAEFNFPDWSDNELTILIHIWEEFVLQFRKYGRNGILYNRTAERLQEMAHTAHRRSAKEVKDKIASLRKIYMANKRKVGKSGGCPSTWKFYDMIHKFQQTLPIHDTSLRHESSRVNSTEDLSTVSINGEDVDVADLPSLPVNETITVNASLFEEEEPLQPSTSSGCDRLSLNESHYTPTVSKFNRRKTSQMEAYFKLKRQDRDSRLTNAIAMHEKLKLMEIEKHERVNEKYEKLSEEYRHCQIRLGIMENERERFISNKAKFIANEQKLKDQVDELYVKLKNSEMKLAIMEEKEELRKKFTVINTLCKRNENLKPL